MANPGQTGDTTKYSEQSLENQSFDSSFGVSVIEMLGYDLANNVLRRVQLDPNGNMIISPTNLDARYLQIGATAGGDLTGTYPNPTLTSAIKASLKPLVYSNITVPGGNTIANTVTQTAFSSSYTFSANALAAGNVIRVKLWGVYGTDVVAPTITGRLKLGSTTMLTTGSVTAVAAVTNGGWSAEGFIVVQSIGGTGALDAQGFAEFSTAATTSLTVNMPNTATIAVDTTASQALTVTVQWGTANAANTITLRQMVVELLA